MSISKFYAYLEMYWYFDENKRLIHLPWLD